MKILVLLTAALGAYGQISPPPSSGPTGAAGGDLSGTYPNPTTAKIHGTTIPTNATANQVPLTTAAAVTAWTNIPACLDSAGQHLNFNTTTHAFSCGTSGGVDLSGVPDKAVLRNTSGAVGGSSFLSTTETTKVLGINGNQTFSNTAVPVAPVAALTGTAGNLPNIIGLSYVQTWVTASGESAPSALSNALTITDHTVSGQTTVTLDTAAPAGVTSKNLYRSVINAVQDGNGCPNAGSDLCQWKKVNSSPIATATASFSDNIADGSLGVVVPGYDTTGSVIVDSFGTILTRDSLGNTYTPSQLVFLSSGYDNQGRFYGFSPTNPPTASGSIGGGGGSGGLYIQGVGNAQGGQGTEYHYLAFGTSGVPTWPLVEITGCQFDLDNCGSPGAGSSTPVTLFGINSDFGSNQFQIQSVSSDTGNGTDLNYLLALNETSTPLGIIEAANRTGDHPLLIQKPNFVAKKSTGQAQPLFKGLEADGTTALPFQILSNGYAAQALHTPASSSEACTAGQFADDADFHYVCTATNTWKRVALSSF